MSKKPHPGPKVPGQPRSLRQTALAKGTNPQGFAGAPYKRDLPDQIARYLPTPPAPIVFTANAGVPAGVGKAKEWAEEQRARERRPVAADVPPALPSGFKLKPYKV